MINIMNEITGIVMIKLIAMSCDQCSFAIYANTGYERNVSLVDI